MATERKGTFGTYYGSTIGNSEPLTNQEMLFNAKYIYSYLLNVGWTANAVAGLLGNLQAESTMNPGRWQSENVGNMSGGFGLVQWTPATKYIEWANNEGYTDYTELDNNLSRIMYEINNNLQWIATSNYDLSFKEFSKSNQSVSYLAKAFLLCYERPADQSEPVQDYRASLAETWYKVITGLDPIIPDNPGGSSGTKKRKYNFLLFNANRRRNQWIRN